MLTKQKNEGQALTKTIYQLGVQCGQSTAQPATTAAWLDRKATRNPQLYIVPYVNAKHRGFANKLLRQFFGAWQFCFSFRAENFTRRTFPRLTVWCLEKWAKRSAESFSGFDSFAFHFDRDFQNFSTGFATWQFIGTRQFCFSSRQFEKRVIKNLKYRRFCRQLLYLADKIATTREKY